MKILILVEETEAGFSAFAPDLPGCAATGSTPQEVEKTMQEALALQRLLRQLGEELRELEDRTLHEPPRYAKAKP